MKALMLLGFSGVYLFLLLNWLKAWRTGRVSRYPAFRDVLLAREPRRFRFWTVVNVMGGVVLAALLAWAWIALANGTLK